uniref:Uncharacterized protein LOC102805096 n=1 Tax=Saccoglossus kowalevskii TaxID=10224 RepID=A0ABM0MR56_SACKO|nr:PREDICTED: uncharacterized protein LOC102805096 [Saccoglossus kowalevskii]
MVPKPSITELTNKRNKERAFLLRVLQPLETAINSFDLKEDNDAARRAITVKKTYLRRQLDLLLAANRKLIDILDAKDDIVIETLDYEQHISDRCETVLQFIEDLQTAHRKPLIHVHDSPVTASTRHRSVQLPKLEITPFQGDPLRWTEFHDTFRSAVHDDGQLSNVQKLTYLRSFLTGEAKRTIEGLQTTDANYLAALDLLTNRYGQRQTIINSHTRSFWELSPPSHTPASLRLFHDEIETTIRGLTALGENQDNYGNLLVPMIMNKLPIPIQQQLARNHEEKTWKLSELSQALCREVRVLSVGKNLNHGAESPNSSIAAFYTQTAHQRGRALQDTATTRQIDGNNVANSRNNRDRRPRPPRRRCIYCDEQHNPSTCTSVTHGTRFYPEFNTFCTNAYCYAQN